MDTHSELDFPVSETFSGVPGQRPPPQVKLNGHHLDCACEVCWYAWEEESSPLSQDSVVRELGERVARQQKQIRDLKRDLYIQTRFVNPSTRRGASRKEGSVEL